jgi:hypothetical protein
MSDTIPPAILANIARAVAIIRAWNAGITLARNTYAGKRRRQRLDRALQTLDLFETRAQALGIPIEALYAACGGKPVLAPDGAAVQEWGYPSTGEQHATPAPASAPVPRQAAHTPRSSKGLGTP